jgi:hypothetical protein
MTAWYRIRPGRASARLGRWPGWVPGSPSVRHGRKQRVPTATATGCGSRLTSSAIGRLGRVACQWVTSSTDARFA